MNKIIATGTPVSGLKRSRSTPSMRSLAETTPVDPNGAVQWIKNRSPEACVSKLPEGVYRKVSQTARIDAGSRKKGVGSGILISENVVLTARHCLDNRDPSGLKIRFGIHKQGDEGYPAYGVSAIHLPDSPLAKSLGLTCGEHADLVLLELDTTGRESPGKTYGFTPIKPLTEAHARSGLYFLGYASGSHLKASAMPTRPVLLSKYLEKQTDLKKWEGKPVFWNNGAQHGVVLSVTKNQSEAEVRLKVTSDTRSNKGYADGSFRVSLKEGTVYNQNNVPIEDVFVGRGILFGVDHIVVAHKAFAGGSGGVFLTETGDVFAVLSGVLDAIASDLPHHVAIRPDVLQQYPHLYQGYMTPETDRTPEELQAEKQNFEVYSKKARQVFSVSTNKLTLYIAFKKNIGLPRRVGGHDDHRNTVGGNQQGSSQSANDHGINQAGQWKRFQDPIMAKIGVRDRCKYEKALKELEGANKRTTQDFTPVRVKNAGKRHNREAEERAAENKKELKAARKKAKKQAYDAGNRF